MNAEVLEKLETNHIALWNEKDRLVRQELIKTIYSNDVKMYDKDFILSGIAEVLQFIDKLFTDDPDIRFTAVKPVQVTQNGVRLFWHIKTHGTDLTGMDFFVLEEDKVKHLYVLMDANG